MKKNLLLDVLIILFAIVFIVSITNITKAETGQAINNTGSTNAGQQNTTVGQSVISNRKKISLVTGLKGDVDGDNDVSASDAAIVLIYAAEQGVEFVKSTAAELAVADVNNDGVINASDAAFILIYAAAEGASSDGTADWNEILHVDTQNGN